jgi:hypothetical protein
MLGEHEELERPTTSSERLAGEFRRWNLLPANWDGEGAAAPDADSLKEAVSFVRLLGERHVLPEPELHASGHAGLLWSDGDIYADIKFLGDGRIAYYSEHNRGCHKGVVDFDSSELPGVLEVLVPA